MTATTSRKAPAKKAAPKAAPTPQHLRWVFPEGIENKLATGQTAVSADTEYAIKPAAEGKWQATAERGGKTTVLVEAGSFGAAYNACIKHNKSA